MPVRRTIARALLRMARWRTTGSVPDSAILVGAPHTSNWDWVLTMLLAWDSNASIRLLVKDSLFRGPLAWILRATGGVPLDRRNPTATMEALLAEAERSDTFLLGIAAEGTRSPGEHWKSGFYRISQSTGLPITLAFLDAPTRTVGWGPTFHPSGDVRADMDLIRDFYRNVSGIRPGNATEPRLREEESGFDAG